MVNTRRCSELREERPVPAGQTPLNVVCHTRAMVHCRHYVRAVPQSALRVGILLFVLNARLYFKPQEEDTYFAVMPVNMSSTISKTPIIQHSNTSKITSISTKKHITIASKKPSQSVNITSKQAITTTSLPPEKNLVSNPSFEDGTTSGWSKLGSVKFDVATAPSPKHGSYLASITDRTETWQGISQDMSSRLIAGETYAVSAFVQLDSAPHDVKISFREQNQDGLYNYKSGANGDTGTANEWVQIQGTYTASSEATSIVMYFEAPSGVNLLIDSVSVAKALRAVNLPGCNFNNFIQRFKPEELDITCSNFAELQMGSFQGSGGVRKVSQATWHGRKVAVKELINNAANQSKKNSMLREASLLFQLRKAENIVKLIGICNSTTIFEYAPTDLQSLVLDEKEEISVGRALSLGLDVVKGLAQLHSVGNGPIVHNDLTLDQYLVDFTGKVQLGDFHSSKYVGLDDYGRKCSYLHCSIGEVYQAPECVLDENEKDEKADIYGVALILWSLRSRELPYKSLEKRPYKLIAGGQKRIIAGERPDLTLVSDYPQEMKDLIVEAWDSDPSKRPSAEDLVKRMEDIVKKCGQLATIGG